MPAKFTQEQFIEKSQSIYGDSHDYSNSIYINASTKVEIICKKHGPFFITPDCYWQGWGCIYCPKEGMKRRPFDPTADFIEKAKLLHGDKYDYSKAIYIKSHEKTEIICRRHGSFRQTPSGHLQGWGCPSCGHEAHANMRRGNKEEFVRRAMTIHEDKYDYSLVIYMGNKTKVEVVCPFHGSFWVTPGNHIFTRKSGCPQCAKCLLFSSKGEREVRRLLTESNIIFEEQKWFDECRNPRTGLLLFFDFYLTESRILIEYDGQQHFESVKYFGGQEKFERTQFRDSLKTNIV